MEIVSAEYDINTKEEKIVTINIDDRQCSIEELLKMIRFERDRLLKESDWTQFNDSPLSETQKKEWINYRQALRDLTETCDLENPIYPTKPK